MRLHSNTDPIYPMHTAEDYDIRTEIGTRDGCHYIIVTPPDSAPSFAISAGHAIVLAARLEAAGKDAISK